jgi:hypothetical protein
MQIGSVVDQELGDCNFPILYCLIERSFLPVIENVDACTTLDQQLSNLEVAVG